MGHSLQIWTQWSLWVQSKSQYYLILWNVIHPIRKPRLTSEGGTWAVWQAGEACKESACYSRKSLVVLERWAEGLYQDCHALQHRQKKLWELDTSGPAPELMFSAGVTRDSCPHRVGQTPVWDLSNTQWGTAWGVPFTGCFRKINSHLVCWITAHPCPAGKGRNLFL